MATNSAAYLSKLHNSIDRSFSLGEIRTLCFNLGVDYESVAGEEKQSRIRELLLVLGRNGRLPELVALAQQERPHIDWPPVPSDLQLLAALPSDTPAAPVNQYNFYGDVVGGDKVSGDQISVGDISGSSGIAIGRGATAVYQGLSSAGFAARNDGTAHLWEAYPSIEAMKAEAMRRLLFLLYDEECLTYFNAAACKIDS